MRREGWSSKNTAREPGRGELHRRRNNSACELAKVDAAAASLTGTE